ncbi:MAG: hypothetical protein ACRDGM_17020 [bacterium]
MAPTKCASVTANAELIEDYTYTVVPPLAANLAGRFVAVQRDIASNRSDLLSVSSDNRRLVLFSNDPQQQATWLESVQDVPHAPGGDIQKLVAFHRGGRLHALVHYPGEDGESTKVWVLELDDQGHWTETPLDTQTALLLTQTTQMDSYQDAFGNLLIFGVSSSYDDPFVFVSTYDPKTGWINLCQERRKGTVGSFSILPGRAQSEVKVLEIVSGQVLLKGATVSKQTFTWIKGDERSLSLPIRAAKVFPVQSQTLKDSFLVQSDDARLYLVRGYYGDSPEVLKLTSEASGTGPAQVVSVQVGGGHDGRMMTFAIEQDAQQLWLLRERADGDATLTPFEDWVPLGTACAEIACPAVMADAAEVYLASIARQVLNLSQDSVNAIWTTTVLEMSKPLSEGVEEGTSYRWELRTLDPSGRPAPGTVVKLTADATTEVAGNGLVIVVDRNHEGVFESDENGTLVLTVKACDLLSPELYVRVPDFMKPGVSMTLHGDDRVHERLAGRAADFPVDVRSLRANGVVPQEMPDASAQAVANALVTCGQFLQEKRNEALTGEFRANRLDRSAWELSFNDRGELSFASITHEQFEGLRQRMLNASALRAGAGSGWNPWGDFVHWFVNAGKGLRKIIAKIEGGVLHVIIDFVDDTREFFLETMAQAGKLLETIFAGIKALYRAAEDFLRKAIEWLRLVFAWSDIKRTSDFIADQFVQTLSTLAGRVEQARSPLEAFFDQAAAALEKRFDELESILKNGGSLDSLFSAARLPSGGRDLRDDTIPKAYAANAVQCNFLASKMPAGGHGIVVADADTSTAAVDFDQLLNSLRTALDLERLKESFVKIQQAAMEIHDASSFFRTALFTFLEVTKDALLLVLEAVKVILSQLLDWLSQGMRATVDLLRAPIYVPVISEIVEKTLGLKLSVLGFVSLIIGFFATVLFKALHGGRAPFPGPTKGALPAGPGGDILPYLYAVRTDCYAAKYAGAHLANADKPAPFYVTLPALVETATTVVTTGIESFPKMSAAPPRGPECHLTSVGIVSISVALGAGYFLTMRRTPEKVLGLDVMVNQIQGFLELVAAIIYTTETYQCEDIGSNERARMAKSYLTSFPDLLWAGALAPDPAEIYVGLLAVGSYLGAEVASCFVETNV